MTGKEKFNYYWRLSPALRREYDASDSVESLSLRVSARLVQGVRNLHATLVTAETQKIPLFCQIIVDEICHSLGVPTIRVVVRGKRPHWGRGELHGLYTPSDTGRRDTLVLWMITAKRRQVVAFRTFLRTLLHEVCHHLDYVFLNLPHSFHTGGFYKRESSLFHGIMKAVRSPVQYAEAPSPSPTNRQVTSRAVRPHRRQRPGPRKHFTQEQLTFL